MHPATQLARCSLSWRRINVFLCQMKIFALSPAMWINSIRWLFSLGRWFLQRLGTRPAIRSYFPLLRLSRLDATTWRAANTRSSSSPTITISADSWILRAWVPGRSNRPWNSLGTTFKSTITRERPMPPLIPCLASPREVRLRNRLFELRTPRFFTAYSPR